MQFPLSAREIRYFRYKLLGWGRANFARFPWRYTSNRWHALVAEIMLQRTNADQVLSVYQEFCRRYPDPEKFLDDKDARVFRNLGLHWREKYLRFLAEKLSNNVIPESTTELRALPGIGDYAASAYLSMHLDCRAAIIDSNVVRLYGRFFGFDTDGETRRKSWMRNLAEKLTPRRNFRDYNYALVDFTRAICLPKPQCSICPIRRKCNYARHISSTA